MVPWCIILSPVSIILTRNAHWNNVSLHCKAKKKKVNGQKWKQETKNVKNNGQTSNGQTSSFACSGINDEQGGVIFATAWNPPGSQTSDATVESRRLLRTMLLVTKPISSSKFSWKVDFVFNWHERRHCPRRLETGKRWWFQGSHWDLVLKVTAIMWRNVKRHRKE